MLNHVLEHVCDEGAQLRLQVEEKVWRRNELQAQAWAIYRTLPSRNTTSIFLSTQSTSDPEVVKAMLDTISCASIVAIWRGVKLPLVTREDWSAP